ncbi:glutamine synthetase family protein [bacterium]|nr:glutamine synthetase family protein [bacterium]
MTAVRGMLTLKQLSQKVKSDEIDTILVVFTDHYGRFMGKRFDADFFLESIVESGTHGCTYLLTVDMEMKVVEGYEYANWQQGYGDFHMVPDMSTLRIASWLEKTAMVICDLENDNVHLPVSQAPRSILQEQIKNAEKLGFSVMAASELEYYLFENSYKEASENGYHNLSPAGSYVEDYHILQGSRNEFYHGKARRHLRDSGVPVENTKGEAGVGQHELNVRYTDVLTMADRHVIFKQCLKEVADQQEVSVTFMAKYTQDQSGSSCHLHISLFKNGKNAFFGKKRFEGIQCSNNFRWFLGGWMSHMPETMVFYAPTINSYKRYQACSWAPTRIVWSYDNRTAGFRIVGHDQSLRIECRIPGADCNPYLAFAAALASGLDGIKNKIEPPEIYNGDVYSADHLPRVPETLVEAKQLFENSRFVKDSFGAEVQVHYTHFFNKEIEFFNNAVTDWEKKRYFEQI